MELSTVKQVRFSKLVEVGGTPKTYLPFGDAEQDKAFMRAVKEERVVTIKQEPTSKQKDFGIVGFLQEKYVTYLLFPKTVGQFSGQRVIGIKYDVLASADMVAFGAPKQGSQSKLRLETPTEKKAEAPKTEKPKPQPKRFTVRVRITSTEDKDLEVTAWNASEAKTKARAEVIASANLPSVRMKVTVLSAGHVR